MPSNAAEQSLSPLHWYEQRCGLVRPPEGEPFSLHTWLQGFLAKGWVFRAVSLRILTEHQSREPRSCSKKDGSATDRHCKRRKASATGCEVMAFVDRGVADPGSSHGGWQYVHGRAQVSVAIRSRLANSAAIGILFGGKDGHGCCQSGKHRRYVIARRVVEIRPPEHGQAGWPARLHGL